MQSSELSVQGQNLHQLYNQYYRNKLLVDRRYQRKLVWTRDEKEKLIDSAVNKLPIPLILLAQRRKGGAEIFELIDGLQRLEAFFSFMENKYPYEGEYFDLATTGDTLAKLHSGDLIQREPVMSRDTSLEIANYQIPVSTYRDAATSSIDEVFRRINSGGRRLSLHEIRQAGVTGPLSDVVRRTSATIRGDGTFAEALTLSEMEKLSISRKDLEYGLDLDRIFWTRHDIIGADDIRSSGDEEMVLDLILDAVLTPTPTSGWQNRDVAYGLPRKIRSAGPSEVNHAITAIGVENLQQRIVAVIELLDEAMRDRGPLGRHMVHLETYEKGTRRQFQAIFSVLYELIFIDEMQPLSTDAVRDVLDNFWGRDLAIPTGGSAWGKDEKAKLYPKVKRRIKKAFFRRESPSVAKKLNARLLIESYLQGPVNEDPLVELKLGFCTLSKEPSENKDLFEEVMQTAVGMANWGRDATGLILIGVADKPSAARRVTEFFGAVSLEIHGQHVVGTEEQISYLGHDVDSWWLKWQAKIKSAPVDSAFSADLVHSFSPLICDGKVLWIMKPRSLGKPISYKNRFFVRVGASTQEMETDDFLSHISRNF
ncbi:GmrSD restriction endonuclease domain-containing protein [Streptomyces sp. MAR4 CNX-425]|uniref:GmrSD restriction endonuclease domain-containing protein n=1 Tax=Streptomyces sp. MAR4 CNX-425 TaxID=3406343 RepID=UPI003B506736